VYLKTFWQKLQNIYITKLWPSCFRNSKKTVLLIQKTAFASGGLYY